MNEKQKRLGRFVAWTNYPKLELGIIAILIIGGVATALVHGIVQARLLVEPVLLSFGALYLIGHLNRLEVYINDE